MPLYLANYADKFIIPLQVILLLFTVWTVYLIFSLKSSPTAKIVAGCIALTIALITGINTQGEEKAGNLAFTLIYSTLYLGCCVSYTGTHLLRALKPEETPASPPSPPSGGDPENKPD